MNPQKLLGLILIIFFFFLRKKLYQINQDLDPKGSVCCFSTLWFYLWETGRERKTRMEAEGRRKRKEDDKLTHRYLLVSV